MTTFVTMLHQRRHFQLDVPVKVHIYVLNIRVMILTLCGYHGARSNTSLVLETKGPNNKNRLSLHKEMLFEILALIRSKNNNFNC